MKTEFKLIKESSKAILVVTGDLVAKSSEQFREQLHVLLEAASLVQLSLKHVTSMDVSSLQLIRSFRAEFESVERKIKILPPDNNELIGLLTETGLVSVIHSMH